MCPAPAGGAPQQLQTQQPLRPQLAAVVAPVQSLATMSGFAYGGHVSGFGGDTVSNMQRAGMTLG
ncbi:MAG UNVERIFIED_CONTAM: hypothetical protein LVT10_16930 [Anaerolineae bacterium]